MRKRDKNGNAIITHGVGMMKIKLIVAGYVLPNEADWEENCEQLMLFLRKMYNFNNDAYEGHPFKIYQIEADNLDKIVQEATRGNVNKFDAFAAEY